MSLCGAAPALGGPQSGSFDRERAFVSGRLLRPLLLPPLPRPDRRAAQFFNAPLTNLLQLWSSRGTLSGELVVRARAIRAGMIRIYARIGVVAGCFGPLLASAGLKPQPLEAGPLEEQAARIAGSLLSGLKAM